jgi:hypothetical protein
MASCEGKLKSLREEAKEIFLGALNTARSQAQSDSQVFQRSDTVISYFSGQVPGTSQTDVSCGHQREFALERRIEESAVQFLIFSTI